MLTKLYKKVLGYASHRYATPILCVIAFIEASFFPIPSDLLVIAMGLAKPKKAIWYALYCTIFSVIGGVAGYMIGMFFWEHLSGFFFQYIMDPEVFEWVRVLYENNAFFTIFISGYTPIPYKIFTISAGVFGISLQIFITASVLGRSLRFFLFGIMIYFYGDRARAWIQKHIQRILVISSCIFIAIFVLFKIYF
ncbi:MAG: DedA family protein [Deltaproteobacteria bacterium]|nr:DedA family protein [Deltaproteobacteria bacterium]